MSCRGVARRVRQGEKADDVSGRRYIGDAKFGKCVGQDQFGNKYFEELDWEKEVPGRHRWVDYSQVRDESRSATSRGAKRRRREPLRGKRERPRATKGSENTSAAGKEIPRPSQDGRDPAFCRASARFSASSKREYHRRSYDPPRPSWDGRESFPRRASASSRSPSRDSENQVLVEIQLESKHRKPGNPPVHRGTTERSKRSSRESERYRLVERSQNLSRRITFKAIARRPPSTYHLAPAEQEPCVEQNAAAARRHSEAIMRWSNRIAREWKSDAKNSLRVQTLAHRRPFMAIAVDSCPEVSRRPGGFQVEGCVFVHDHWANGRKLAPKVWPILRKTSRASGLSLQAESTAWDPSFAEQVVWNSGLSSPFSCSEDKEGRLASIRAVSVQPSHSETFRRIERRPTSHDPYRTNLLPCAL